MMRWLVLLLFVLLAIVAYGYGEAIQMPVVREATIAMPDWPAGAPPLRTVLISDLHVAGPDTPPARLAQVVERVNRLQPDVVLIAGDFLSYRDLTTTHYTPAQSVAPLAALRPPLGVVAVLGNHDYDTKGATVLPPLLARVGVTVLRNQAVRRGALTIAGGDDYHPGHFEADKLDAAVAALPGPRVLLTHSPDPAVPLGLRYPVVLAGHTHCGQIVPPFYGPLITASAYGQRYSCGLIASGARRFVVTAGIGTSVVPFRWGAPPDLWVLTFTGRDGRASGAAAR
jgi:predicted MPP superfamily phosphohydrolase